MIRQAIVDAVPEDASFPGESLSSEHLYIPPAHIKALRLESQLVVGTSGTGKSVWRAALTDIKLREFLGASVPELGNAEIRLGFSECERPALYPDPVTFTRILDNGFNAYTVWRAVVARWAARIAGKTFPESTWERSVVWVNENPESLAILMQQADEKLAASNVHGLIVFDALDQLSTNWQTTDNIVRDLLRVALWLKPFRRLWAKIFLREDLLERVTDFPDASKLLATKAELTWAHHDLHGLLWQYLLNAPKDSGEFLRKIYCATIKRAPKNIGEKWFLTDDVKREASLQRTLFDALAGSWMGRDRRRGVPYVWTVSHLADGQGRTFPRSFLVAIRQAAEDSQERYPDHTYALHYESIKRGVQKASEIRVNELAKDYLWVRIILEPLQGLTRPVTFEDILKKWEIAFPNGLEEVISDKRCLPPKHIAHGWRGVQRDLLQLGVFEERKDGRLDMPDLYRAGFRLGYRREVNQSQTEY